MAEIRSTAGQRSAQSGRRRARQEVVQRFPGTAGAGGPGHRGARPAGGVRWAPMLPAALERLETTVPDEALVLDVGGWGAPLNRADWVLDVQPYDTRGPDGSHGEV